MRCKKCQQEYPSNYYFKVDHICLNCFNKLSTTEQNQVMIEANMKYTLTSTTFTIEGHKIVRHLGVVRGIVVRSRSIFGTIGASLQTLVGGNISLFTELCEKTREEAFETMMIHAQQIGANAVIGVRYDTTEIMQGVSEVLCYGTAVVVEPIKE